MGLKFWTQDNVEKASTTLHVETTLSKDLASYGDVKLLAQIVDKMADMWIEKYGAQLLEELAPGEIKGKLHDEIAKRVLGAIKHD